MNEISDLIFEANKNIFKNQIDINCNTYNNGLYKIKKFYENNKLMGVFVHIDLEGIRYVVEAAYIGKEHFKIFKYWRKLFKECNVYRARVVKVNYKIVNFYLKLNFKIIKTDNEYYYFEFRRIKWEQE